MSTPAKHTAGPWKHNSESVDPNWHIVTAPGGRIIANIHIAGNKTDEANAGLIVAAPDLLAALIEAEAFIKRTSGGGETDFRAKLNAAIRLATPVLEREGE